MLRGYPWVNDPLEAKVITIYRQTSAISIMWVPRNQDGGYQRVRVDEQAEQATMLCGKCWLVLIVEYD